MSEQRTVALITGGASGIGRAVGEALLADGCAVTLMDRDPAAVERCRAELPAGGDWHLVAGDVTVEADCQRAVDETLARHGALNVLFNNAGIGVSSLRDDAELDHPTIEELDLDTWRRFLEVNVLGAVAMTRAAIAHLKAAPRARIVNNTTSYLTMHRLQPYGASKSALESISAVWAKELAGSGVTVNVVVPGGPTDTPFVKEIGLAREKMLPASVMAPPIRWLVSAQADGVTGRRFVAGHWDTTLDPAGAAAKCARGIAWPELTGDVVWGR